MTSIVWKFWDKQKVPFCNGKTDCVFCLITRQVYTWGKGYCGALGHGDESDQSFPQLVVGLNSVRAVQVLPSSSLFLGIK
jgi:alpha-tubulin suppressor-like RCC1 family protein